MISKSSLDYQMIRRSYCLSRPERRMLSESDGWTAPSGAPSTMGAYPFPPPSLPCPSATSSITSRMA